jgi:hypothetical protein
VEASALQDLGTGLPAPLKRIELLKLTQTTWPLVRCPSRPGRDLCPADPIIHWRNAEIAAEFARSDYAGNGGDVFAGIRDGPLSLVQGDSNSYAWPVTSGLNGVFHLRSSVRSRDVTDGLSNTYLIAEKYASRHSYNNYGDVGHDQPYVVGDDWDLVRWTSMAPLPDGKAMEPERFGSAHAGVFYAALCDGSVRGVSYSIDQNTHRHLGNRSDGQPVHVP